MSQLDKKLDEILRNRVKFIGDNEWTLLGYPVDVIKELSEAIKQLMADEFEKIIGEDSKFREPEDDLDRGVQIGYDTLRNELRQKLEELKK